MTSLSSKAVSNIEKVIQAEVSRQTLAMRRKVVKLQAQRDNWRTKANEYRDKLQTLTAPRPARSGNAVSSVFDLGR